MATNNANIMYLAVGVFGPVADAELRVEHELRRAFLHENVVSKGKWCVNMQMKLP